MKFLAVLLPYLLLPNHCRSDRRCGADGSRSGVRLSRKKVLASYPNRASAHGVEGTVVLNVLISEAGAVQEAALVSRDQTLAQAAIDAMKQWKYRSWAAQGKPTPVAAHVRFGFHLKSPPYSFDQEEATSFPPQFARLQISSTPAPMATGSRLQVAADETQGLLLKSVEPLYPQEAKDAHVQGVVLLRVMIDKEGGVSSVTPHSGPQQLFSSSAEAVGQWKYRAYRLNGERVELDTTVAARYRLDR